MRSEVRNCENSIVLMRIFNSIFTLSHFSMDTINSRTKSRGTYSDCILKFLLDRCVYWCWFKKKCFYVCQNIYVEDMVVKHLLCRTIHTSVMCRVLKNERSSESRESRDDEEYRQIEIVFIENCALHLQVQSMLSKQKLRIVPPNFSFILSLIPPHMLPNDCYRSMLTDC